MLKVRVLTFDTKENTIGDTTFPEFHSDDFDIYLTECYEKLENGEIFGIKITRYFDGKTPKIPIAQAETPVQEVCVPA